MKKTIICACCLLLLLAGFSCKRKVQSEGEEPAKVRVVLDWTPNTNHTGLYVAQALGYFQEVGLEVEIIQPGENTAEKIVASGQADFGVSYQESVTIARSEQIPIKSIAAIIQHNTSGFASLKKDGVKSVKDFEGKRYGSSGWPSELPIIAHLMKSKGFNFNRVKVVSGVYDFFTTIGKDADFEWIYWGWDGVQAKLRNIAIEYIPIRELDPIFDFYTPVLIGSDQTLNERPELVKSFLGAVSKGYGYCIKNPDEAAAILVKAEPSLDPEHVKRSLEYLKDQYQAESPKWGLQQEIVWKRFSDWMLDNKIIQEPVATKDLFTNEYLP